MFDVWRRRRELKKRIAALKKRETEAWTGFLPEDPGDKPPMPAGLPYKLCSAERALDELETERLLGRAHRRGIQIPSGSSWWYGDTDYDDKEVSYLTDIGKAGVSIDSRRQKGNYRMVG
jgi:hypothetical protein